MSRLVQYIIINGHILDLGWNKGAVIAQACHASVSVLMHHRDDPAVQAYCSPDALPSMTKIVLKASKDDFEELRAQLAASSIDHWAWVEEPDKVCSAIALKPAEKEQVENLVRHLKLYR